MRLQSVVLGAFGLFLSTAVAAPAEAFDFDDFEFDPELDAHYDMLLEREPCHPAGLHVIAASGAGSNNFHSLGLLESTINDVVGAIPHSTMISLPYPKEAASYNAPNPAAAIAKGTHNMRRYLRKFHKRCPNTPIALIGYSSGGVMASNNVCGGQGVGQLPHNYRKNVIAVVTYGDETFVSGQSWNAGTCTSGQGTHPRDPATCEFFASKLKEYCDAPDPDCCGGDDTESHFAYPGEYDSDVTSFVQGQFNSFSARR